MENEKLLTAKEVSEILRYKIKYFYSLKKKGLPAATKRPLRFKLSEVIKWLEDNSKRS